MSWFPKKCVVVPIDFSSASDEAIQTAIELARRPEEVHVVHVALVPDIIPYAGEVIAPVAPERWLHLAQTHLDDYLKSRPQFAGATPVFTGLRHAGAHLRRIARDLSCLPARQPFGNARTDRARRSIES